MHLRTGKSYLFIALFHLCLAAGPVFGQTQGSTIVDSLLTEGDLFYHRLDNRQAIRSYEKALEHDPSSFEVLTRLSRTVQEYGMDLEADNRNDEAERRYEEAIGYAVELEQLHPDSARTQYLLAASKRSLSLIQGGRQKARAGKEIERHCLRGLALDSTDALLHVLYGVFIREIATMSWVERAIAQALVGEVPDGNKEQALNYISHAVELDPTLHIAHFEAALTYLSIGRRTEAVFQLELAESLPVLTTQDHRNQQIARRMLERLRIE